MRLGSLLAVGVIATATSVTASATPVYYTFSGTINGAVDASSGSAEYPPSYGGFEVNVSTVTWTIKVDTSLPGYRTYYGTPSGPLASPYFYTEYVAGDGLAPTGIGYADDQHLGFDTGTDVQMFVAQFPGMNPNYLYVRGPTPLSSYSVGDTGFYGESYTDDRYGAGASGLYGWVTSDMELIRIADTPPDAVPEPVSALLFGTGVVGLALRRRRASLSQPAERQRSRPPSTS